jgi:hypothetical protein
MEEMNEAAATAAAEPSIDFIKKYRQVVNLEFMGITDEVSLATRKELREKSEVIKISLDALAKKCEEEQSKCNSQAKHS